MGAAAPESGGFFGFSIPTDTDRYRNNNGKEERSLQITVEDLRGFRALCAEIRRIENKIKSFAEQTSDIVQSGADHPFTVRSVRIEGVRYPPGLAGDRRRLVELQARKRQIERAVEEIPVDRVRFAVLEKFIDPAFGSACTWEQIADEVDDGWTGDALRMAVTRFIQHWDGVST